MSVTGGIVDTSTYSGAMPGRRRIELRDENMGPVLGWLTEYPTDETRFSFTPNATVWYATLAPVVEALRSHGVRISEPATVEAMNTTDLDDLPF